MRNLPHRTHALLVIWKKKNDRRWAEMFEDFLIMLLDSDLRKGVDEADIQRLRERDRTHYREYSFSRRHFLPHLRPLTRADMRELEDEWEISRNEEKITA